MLVGYFMHLCLGFPIRCTYWHQKLSLHPYISLSILMATQSMSSLDCLVPGSTSLNKTGDVPGFMEFTVLCKKWTIFWRSPEGCMIHSIQGFKITEVFLVWTQNQAASSLLSSDVLLLMIWKLVKHINIKNGNNSLLIGESVPHIM